MDTLGRRIEGRKNNGSKPGDNRGGGPKPNIERLVANAKEEGYKIAKAEFWVKLAEEKGVPRLIEILEAPLGTISDKTLLAAVKEVLDRAMGKPKESIDHTTNGKELPTPILPLGYVRSDNSNAEDPSTHQANTSAPGGDIVLQDSVDALIPDSESASG